ncbi:hypothetical protein NQZ79_g503 [Umbelopsis isabellina]|nr:hypothetical protein NQZ79_g503 [Umbelopsis isabellina]
MNKVKCSADHPMCERCIKHNLKCTYGGETKIDLFQLTSINETVHAMVSRMDKLEDTLNQLCRTTNSLLTKLDNEPNHQTNKLSCKTIRSKDWSLSLNSPNFQIAGNGNLLSDLYQFLVRDNSQRGQSMSETGSVVMPSSPESADISANNERTETVLGAVVARNYSPWKSTLKTSTFPLYNVWESNNNAPAQSNMDITNLPQETLDQMMEHYLNCFLCLPSPDVEALLTQYKQKTLCSMLQNAILAWSARHAAIYHGMFQGKDPNVVGEQFFATAKELLKTRFLEPTFDTMHALLVLYIYAIAHAEKPFLFPDESTITVGNPSVLSHETGDQRYRVEFVIYRHQINKIHHEIAATIAAEEPMITSILALDQQLKDWYQQLPFYLQYRTSDRHSDKWITASFREQACIKLGFEYHFQICQLYSTFLSRPGKQYSPVSSDALQTCLYSCDMISELLDCWVLLEQPWCHFTIETLLMATLIYGREVSSSDSASARHAKQQLTKYKRILSEAPVRHHMHVKRLIKQIADLLDQSDSESPVNTLKSPTTELKSPNSDTFSTQTDFYAQTLPDDDMSQLDLLTVPYDAYEPSDLYGTGLYQFTDFIYTPALHGHD